MAETLGDTLIGIKDNLVKWVADIIQNINDVITSISQESYTIWFNITKSITDLKTSLQTFFDELGTKIYTSIYRVFECIFALDMDIVMSEVNLHETWKTKFAIFYDIQESFQNLYDGVSNNSEQMSLFSSSNDYVDIADPMKINMQLPEWLGGETVCILDMSEPELFKLFAFCRTFLKFGLWFGFIFHIVHSLRPKLSL